MVSDGEEEDVVSNKSEYKNKLYNELFEEDLRNCMNKLKSSSQEDNDFANNDIMNFTTEMIFRLRENKILWIPSDTLISNDSKSNRRNRSDPFTFMESNYYSLQMLIENLPLHESIKQSNYDIIMMPIVLPHIHWSLAVYYKHLQKQNEPPIIHYYDSLDMHFKNNCLASEQYRYALNIIHKYNTVGELGRPNFPPLFSSVYKSPKLVLVNDVPIQTYGWECGYYLLLIVNLILQKSIFNIYEPLTKEDMEYEITMEKCLILRKTIYTKIKQYINSGNNIFKNRLISINKLDCSKYFECLDNCNYIYPELLTYLIKRFSPPKHKIYLHTNFVNFKNSCNRIDLFVLHILSETIINNNAILIKYSNKYYLYYYGIKDEDIFIKSLETQLEVNHIIRIKTNEQLTPFQKCCCTFIVSESIIKSCNILTKTTFNNICSEIKGNSVFIKTTTLINNMKRLFLNRLIMDESLFNDREIYLFRYLKIKDNPNKCITSYILNPVNIETSNIKDMCFTKTFLSEIFYGGNTNEIRIQNSNKIPYCYSNDIEISKLELVNVFNCIDLNGNSITTAPFMVIESKNDTNFINTLKFRKNTKLKFKSFSKVEIKINRISMSYDWNLIYSYGIDVCVKDYNYFKPEIITIIENTIYENHSYTLLLHILNITPHCFIKDKLNVTKITNMMDLNDLLLRFKLHGNVSEIFDDVLILYPILIKRKEHSTPLIDNSLILSSYKLHELVKNSYNIFKDRANNYWILNLFNSTNNYLYLIDNSYYNYKCSMLTIFVSTPIFNYLKLCTTV